jgi:hypothetical protein
MEEQITLEDVYRLLGERDVVIHKLQQELLKLRQKEENQKQPFRPKEVEHG